MRPKLLAEQLAHHPAVAEPVSQMLEVVFVAHAKVDSQVMQNGGAEIGRSHRAQSP
jgi:hypothetical protein